MFTEVFLQWEAWTLFGASQKGVGVLLKQKACGTSDWGSSHLWFPLSPVPVHLRFPLPLVTVLQCLDHLGCAGVVLSSPTNTDFILYCEFHPFQMGELLSGYYDLDIMSSGAETSDCF